MTRIRRTRSHTNTLVYLAAFLCAVAVVFAVIARNKLEMPDWLACMGAVFALIGTVLTAIGVIVDPKERAALKKSAECADGAAAKLEGGPSLVTGISASLTDEGQAKSLDAIAVRLEALEVYVSNVEHVISEVQNAFIKSSDYGRFGLVFLCTGTVVILIGLGWRVIMNQP